MPAPSPDDARPRPVAEAPSEVSKEGRSTGALGKHNRLLYEIVSQTEGDFDTQMRRALARTTELLGLDRGMLARVSPEQYTVELCHCPDGTLQEGQVFDLEDTYCCLVIKKKGLVAINHLGASDFRERRCYETLALESYIGTPVRHGEQSYGALAFSGKAEKQPPFTEADCSLVRLLGQWMGAVLRRRHAERAQHESEERFRLLAENASDLVCLHDLRGRCIYASPSSKRLLGYAPEELVGISPLELAHPDDCARIRAAAGRALRGASDVMERVRLRHKDGTYRWCETAGRPVYAADGATVLHFLTSTRDVSERVAAEQALARSNETLRQRNRELQDFAYIASHDLQEPLRKVRAFAGLMREDYASEVDEDGRYYLERMENGAERMGRLVSDLLSLSRVTTDHRAFEPVPLPAVAEEVCADLELRIEETGARVEIGALPTVEADRTQMRQLLQNLVSNALKFHRADVPPVVELRDEPAAAEQADEGGKAGTCRIVVEDNGIGFEEKFVDRIFTPLQRLHGHDAYEGTGIGLAVCRRIAERHGGTIEAESMPGHGSRFIVTLPRRHTSPPSSTGDTAAPGDAPARRPLSADAAPTQ